MTLSFAEIDTTSINTIRVLAADATAKANSGHPGAPMGLAPTAHTLFQGYLRFNPSNPSWFGRDRFVLSNGHACMLQYALLHLYGYKEFPMSQIEQFRQLHSKTPGHPEFELDGIEVTTGPLGQGVSNAVGLAIAEAQLAASFNKPGFDLIDNYTYTILGDGCLQEGVASEAMSLAGHLKLGKLIAFYDDNHITIDGDTNVSFTEDVIARVESYGWHTIIVEDGDNDIQAISKAIEAAQKVTDKPSLIKIRTTIGYSSLLQGTHSVHGSPLKPDDIKHVKKTLGFDPEKSFYVPEEVYSYYKQKAEIGAKLEKESEELLEKYTKEYPELASELKRRLKGDLPSGWEKSLPTFTPADKAVATRKLSEGVITALYDVLPEMVGGSADLTGSNLTRSKNAVDFQPASTGLGDYSGRYFRFGVREHGMGAIINGISAYGAFIPYGGTFLNFVSYAAGAVRLAALSGHKVIWVATHDSIGLGEDGPTHQPIETLAHFRSLPKIQVWRPADGNETSAAYYKAITGNTPSIIALSRQNLPQLEGSSIEKASKGGYTLVDAGKPDIILVSTGSEVSLCVETVAVLKKQGVSAGVVSIPDWHTFDEQPIEYKLSVLPDGVPILSVEVLATLGWQKYSHTQFGIDTFGASGPAPKVYEFFGFTADGVAERAVKTVKFWHGKPLISPVQSAF